MTGIPGRTTAAVIVTAALTAAAALVALAAPVAEPTMPAGAVQGAVVAVPPGAAVQGAVVAVRAGAFYALPCRRHHGCRPRSHSPSSSPSPSPSSSPSSLLSPSPSSSLSPPPNPSTSSSSPGGLRSQLGFNTIAADEEFNEPACAIGTCSSELGANWDAKTEGANSYHAAFGGWADIGLTGSELDIQATVDSSGTWTGGWLEGTNLGHFVPPYYVEVRAQDPAVYGMWPAPGWTWSWPYGTTCGVEVDFAEMLGRWPTTVPQTVNGCPNPLDKHITTASPGISDWHVYSAAVYADHVDFYIDGTLTSTTYNTEVPGGGVNRTAPADLTTWLVPGACGSWADCPKSGTPDQQMYVDWIRAWVK